MLEAEALHEDPELIEEVTHSVERVNADHARIEGIKRWHILAHDLTVADGELTPTLKVKRKVVLDRHARLISQLYSADLLGRTGERHDLGSPHPLFAPDPARVG